MRRYKRFFVDIESQGETITAHLPNTGSLKGCLEPGQACLFSVSEDPKRKLPCTLLMVKAPQSWVGVNTHFANTLTWEAYQAGLFWSDFDGGQKEVKINDKSRIDMVVWKASEDLPVDKKISKDDFEKHAFHFIEVKSVSLCENGFAMFPDAVTLRGQKHIEDLVELIGRGHTAEMVFVVQRQDASEFRPAVEIDPEYSTRLSQAIKRGLKVTAVSCHLSRQEIRIEAKNRLRVSC